MYKDELETFREDLDVSFYHFNEFYNYLLNLHDGTGSSLCKQVIERINNLIFYVDSFLWEDEWP